MHYIHSLTIVTKEIDHCNKLIHTAVICYMQSQNEICIDQQNAIFYEA